MGSLDLERVCFAGCRVRQAGSGILGVQGLLKFVFLLSQSKATGSRPESLHQSMAMSTLALILEY